MRVTARAVTLDVLSHERVSHDDLLVCFEDFLKLSNIVGLVGTSTTMSARDKGLATHLTRLVIARICGSFL